VLLVVALVYALLRRLRGPGAPAGRPARTPGLPAIAAFVGVLGLATFAWRLVVPIGSYWPVVGLPTPAYLPQYVLLFAVGAMAYRPRRGGLRHRHPHRVLALFRERWNRQGASGGFLSSHAYAVYVIHPLVLVALGYAFAWLDATAIVKFLVVGTLAVPLCWTAAYAVRSLPVAVRVL
jgi:hypothetical protein